MVGVVGVRMEGKGRGEGAEKWAIIGGICIVQSVRACMCVGVDLGAVLTSRRDARLLASQQLPFVPP